MSIHYSLWARNTYERPGKWLCKGRKSKKYHKNGWIWCMLASLWLLYATFNGFHVFSSLTSSYQCGLKTCIIHELIFMVYSDSAQLWFCETSLLPQQNTSCDYWPNKNPGGSSQVSLRVRNWEEKKLFQNYHLEHSKEFPSVFLFAGKNSFPRCSPQIHIRIQRKKFNPTSQLLNLKSRLNAKTCHSPDGRLIEIGRGALPTPKHDSIGIIGTFAMSKHLTLLHSWPNIGVTLAWWFHVII